MIMSDFFPPKTSFSRNDKIVHAVLVEQSGRERADTGRKAITTQGVTWRNGCLLLAWRGDEQVAYLRRRRPESDLILES